VAAWICHVVLLHHSHWSHRVGSEAASKKQWQNGFTVAFELDPHGTVHNNIGKDIWDIRRSARDPIFWLHHANIDRLWTVWTKNRGRKNPPPASTWAQASFTFDTAVR
jgi:tyrosinase